LLYITTWQFIWYRFSIYQPHQTIWLVGFTYLESIKMKAPFSAVKIIQGFCPFYLNDYFNLSFKNLRIFSVSLIILTIFVLI
jgi:hypothetical protein